MRESRTLEYKESITNTFLKTVSAFANYGSGEIIFGITDDGRIIGIRDPKASCLDIENRINDSIDPVPEYTLSVNEKTSVITLKVQEGLHKPYMYKAKAYRRNDSATIAVDRLELARLILEGQNTSYEELPASDQSLSFQILEEKLKAVLQIDDSGAVPWKEERRKCLIAGVCLQSLIFRALWAFFILGIWYYKGR